MKRSEINKALKELEAMCAREHCYLPPFCHFTPEEWQSKGHEYDEVRDCMLGWDITDYGLGDFDKVGMSLITIRNGNRAMQDKYPKVYAEKLLYMKEGQYSPNHFHWYKTEDIINRGGGNILIRVYNSLPDESIDKESDVTVHCDGRTYTVPAGTQVKLTPGESIHIQQYMYHDFEVEPGTGAVLLGEVSQCNDDNTDNRFNPPVGRFPKIEEDEEGAIMSVTELYEELSHKLFGLRLGLLHGKMKDAEKNAVMADFKEGRLDCLVSTTVIEVGVDVPNASIMVIYNAERFGLSQLHQLRGRVGRSELKSYCFLLTGSESPSAVERLKIMKTTNDGFKISEYDYEMRGSGDFLGTRQSGKFMGELGNLNYSTASIFLAKKISDEVFSSGKNLDLIRAISLEKYNRLKDVTLN